MKRWLLAFGGVLLAAALVILGRDGRQLKRVEGQRDIEKAKRSKASLAKAEKLTKKAATHKAAARDAADLTTKILEARSEKDHDMDDLLSAWESKRVQQRPS